VARLITVYWRDIPAQVIGREGRSRARRELAPRFLQAIDRAAMRAGKGQSQLYLDEWRRESEEVDGELGLQVEERAARLEGAFPPERLERLVRSGGVDDEREPPGGAPAG